MTSQEQIHAIQQYGYTEREAAFLATAALHSGYFLTRQFSLDRGKVAVQFRRKIVALGHGKVTTHANRVQLMHLSAKPLYRSLEQENNRHRRRLDLAQVRRKVMGLDYVLAHSGSRFLPTEQDKLAYFCEERKLARSVLPCKVYRGKGGNTERFFVDKNPIRVDPHTGQVWFCYLDDGVYLAGAFPTWLGQYAPLLRAVGTAEVVYVAAHAGSFGPAQKDFEKHFPTRDTALSADLRSYFEMRQEFETAGLRGRSQAVLDIYRKLSRRFSEPRFEEHYQLWRQAAEAGETNGKPPSGPTFSSFRLPYDYTLFGLVLVGKPRGSDLAGR